MGADENLQRGPAGGRRSWRVSLFYKTFVSRVFELGEIARMEIEIQKSIPPASQQPRCPSWHNCSSPEQQDSKHH